MLKLAINIQRYPEMTQLHNIHIIICSTCSRKSLTPLLQVPLLQVGTCVSTHRHPAHLCPPCPWHRPRHEQSVSYHCHWGTLKSEIRAPGGREGNDIGFVGKSIENLHSIQKYPIVPSSQMAYTVYLHRAVSNTHSFDIGYIGLQPILLPCTYLAKIQPIRGLHFSPGQEVKLWQFITLYHPMSRYILQRSLRTESCRVVIAVKPYF